jgi:SprT-like family
MPAKTTWTDKRLERLFARYNRRYWNGKLPAYSVRVDSTSLGAYCYRKTRTITMNVESMRSDREVRSVLVHEMVHAATGLGHGATWQVEMARLKAAGAPTSSNDYWLVGGRGPSAAMLRECEDAIQRAAGDWEAFLRWLGYRFGHTDSHGRPRGAASARLMNKLRKMHKVQMERLTRQMIGQMHRAKDGDGD